MVKHLGADSSRKLLLGLKGQEDGEKLLEPRAVSDCPAWATAIGGRSQPLQPKARLDTPGPIARQDLPLAEPNRNWEDEDSLHTAY